MEKFAVDLEKVLDEFEYNEEREENISTPLIKASPLTNLGSSRPQVVSRPPAASYRRPSFEPINLADADFAASPPKSSVQNFKIGIPSKPTDNSFSLPSSGDEINNRNYLRINDNGLSCPNNQVNINKQIILEPEDISSNVWKVNSSVASDEKPDLLEYNLKNGDLVTSNLDIQSQLPDLTTSVRTSSLSTNNNEVESGSNSLDLISSASGNLLQGFENVFQPKSEVTVTEEGNSEEPSICSVVEESKLEKATTPENQCFDSTTIVSGEESKSIVEREIEIPIEVPLNCENSVTVNDSFHSKTSVDTEKQPTTFDSEKREKTLNLSKEEENSITKPADNDSLVGPQLVGFSADSDVSESELEEYLRELEELDESIKESETLKNFEMPGALNSGKHESDTEGGIKVSVTFESETVDSNRTIEKESKNEMANSKINDVVSSKVNTVPITTGIETSAQSSSIVSDRENTAQDESKFGFPKVEGSVCDSINDVKIMKASNQNTHSESITRNDTSELGLSKNPFDGDKDNDDEKDCTNPFGDEFENECNSQIEESVKESHVNKTLGEQINTNPFEGDSDDTSSEREPVEAELNSALIKSEINDRPIQVGSETYENSNEDEHKKVDQIEPSAVCEPGCSSNPSQGLESSVKMIPIKTASESASTDNVDEAGVVVDEDKPLRPNSLELPRKITVETSNAPQTPPERPTGVLVTELGGEDRRLGKIPPFWVPDTEANMCMQCQLKFTVIKRRHHCRACGQVLCYKCCGLKAPLEYMNFAEARVCQPCFTILEAVRAAESSSPLGRQPNPNNPMEYCSTIPPLQQAATSMHQPPPSVMVPVGVLKREGRVKSEVTKQVMFSDGIRPGGDLTELDGSGEPRLPFRRPGRLTKRVGTPPGGVMSPTMRRVMDPTTHSFIPAEGDALPPAVTRLQAEVSYSDLDTPIALKQPPVKFALNRNLFVSVQRVLLDCCVNRESWCFCSEGLACVGQDEIVFLLECLPNESLPPKDVFLLINSLYQDAAKGSTVSEMSFTPTVSNTLLGSRDHGGFLYIRTSYQCTAQLCLPPPPYLVALLIHRWETPWARLFPLRLVLRLGAEFRYYPCPLVSVRNRPPLYTEIGHTIINILADFRKYSYTLPSVRGLVIHMEDRQTTIKIPRNRYDQVVRALNNSNDSVLAFGANLSLDADSHLVCMQSTEDENTSYHTQAINIHNKPRKVTGASFVVFNGALKVPGLAGKSNIVEDGLMVQVPGETMTALRTALRDMRDYTLGCGPNAEETVLLQWTSDDTNFNIGVKSCIDGKPLDGVPSIRVHNGTDYSGGTKIIRWTEVFILQCEDSVQTSEPVDISRVSERIARATCMALVHLLDMLTAANLTTLAVRATIHPDSVGYEAGSNGEKLPPLYMKSLDNELIAVVHQAALSSQQPAILELVFHVMEQG